MCHAGHHGAVLAESEIRAPDRPANLDLSCMSPYCFIEGDSSGVGASHRLIDALAGDRVRRLRRITQEDDPVKLAALGREIAAKQTADRSPDRIKVAQTITLISLQCRQE